MSTVAADDAEQTVYDGLQLKDPSWLDHFLAEASEFAAECRTELDACGRAGSFPRDVYRAMGARGWVAPFAPVELGGLGAGIAEYCVVEEEVGHLGLVPPQISIQGQRWLIDWGTTEQRDRYLGGIARGELIFSESISEPGVGSSLKLMQATARQDGGDWILNGTKTHVNLGHQSDVTLFYAMAPEGLTAFLVDTATRGVSSVQTDPIGLRLIPTATMMFDDVRVPSTCVLGNVGRGMDTFFSTFNVSRLGNASELIGIGRRAIGDAVNYGSTRQVGESHVTDFQGIQWTVADAYSALYAASLARNHAAHIVDSGADPAFATSLAKKLAIEAGEKAVNDSFALVGGHGLYTDTAFGQLLHDVKILRIAGGSLEVLRNYVGRRALQAFDAADDRS